MFSLVRVLEVKEESLSRAYCVVIIQLFSCYPYNCRFIGKATGATIETDSKMKIHVKGMLENIPRGRGNWDREGQEVKQRCLALAQKHRMLLNLDKNSLGLNKKLWVLIQRCLHGGKVTAAFIPLCHQSLPKVGSILRLSGLCQPEDSFDRPLTRKTS